MFLSHSKQVSYTAWILFFSSFASKTFSFASVITPFACIHLYINLSTMSFCCLFLVHLTFKVILFFFYCVQCFEDFRELNTFAISRK